MEILTHDKLTMVVKRTPGSATEYRPISSEVIIFVIIVVYIRARGVKRKKMIKRRKFYRGADLIKYIDPNEGEALRRGGGV